MQSIKLSLVASFCLAFTPNIEAEDKASLVSTKVVWNQPPRNSGTDLVRFKDQWFVAYIDRESNSNIRAVRIISSANEGEWKSVALLTSPTPKRGVYRPRFSVSPNGQLMVSAVGVVPNPNADVPVPKYGGTVNTMAWLSDAGKSWSKSERIGVDDFPFGRVVWNNASAFSLAKGCICGNATTIRVFSSEDGRRFESVFEETFQDFPREAELLLSGDSGYCLMSRSNGLIADTGVLNGFVGTSKAPYVDWRWKQIDARIKYPNLLRLPDGRLLAVVGIVDEMPRTSLCEIDPSSGDLKKLLEIPTRVQMPVGLALHEGQVWVSYHAPHDETLSVHLAQVNVK